MSWKVYQTTFSDLGLIEYEVIDAATNADIRTTARMLAEEANEAIDQARELRQRVISYGGISKSSYESIPVWYKRTDGQALDCLATELGYVDEDAIWLEIQGAENVLRRLPVVKGKRLQRFRVMDFWVEAEDLAINLNRNEFDDVPF